MAKAFTIDRVGHVGIQVTDMDRSLEWYRDILGLTLTGRWPMGENGEMAFMRFGDCHHDLVLFTHPTPVARLGFGLSRQQTRGAPMPKPILATLVGSPDDVGEKTRKARHKIRGFQRKCAQSRRSHSVRKVQLACRRPQVDVALFRCVRFLHIADRLNTRCHSNSRLQTHTAW